MQEPTFVIVKNGPDTKALERYFSTLEKPGLKPEDEFEPPVQALRRVLGENFYKLPNGEDEFFLKQRYISFDESHYMDDPQITGAIFDAISCYYDGFIVLASGSEANFTQEFIKEPLMKIAITNKDGAIINTLALDDLKGVLYYENGLPKGLYRMNDIRACMEKIESIQRSVQNGSLPPELLKENYKVLNDYNEKVKTIYGEIVHNFFEVIKTKAGLDDITVKDVLDVTVWFATQATIPDMKGGTKTVLHSEVVQLHDRSHMILENIKNAIFPM